MSLVAHYCLARNLGARRSRALRIAWHNRHESQLLRTLGLSHF